MDAFITFLALFSILGSVSSKTTEYLPYGLMLKYSFPSEEEVTFEL